MNQYTPEQLTAFWSAIAALATLAAAFAAIVTLLALRADSRDRTRPMMGAYLQPHPLSHGTSELVVTNYGSTAACDVRVSFDPPLPMLEGSAAAGKITPYLQRRYAAAIPTVAPTMRLINLYTVGGDANDEPVPTDFTVTFNYTDLKRRKSDQEVLTAHDGHAQEQLDHGTARQTGWQRHAQTSGQGARAIARGLGRR